MLPFDFTQPLYFSLLVIAMCLVVNIRFFIVTGIFHLIFFTWKPKSLMDKIINDKPYPKGQWKKEIYYSVIASCIFGFVGAIGVLIWQLGWTDIYLEPAQYGYWYLPVSLLLSMFIHEICYYFLHKWMHHPKIYKKVHKIHHDSVVTSVWTAFSFHPLESIIQALVLPLIVIVLPLHPIVILIHLTIMTLFSVIDHLNFEIFPNNFHKHPIGKWIIGATHHHLHHVQFRYNYGLYFTFLDKWLGTESPKINSRK
jgi:sterol desaturase/sphingolipid hydroxylase (fatty acid hydroxylase superfamily)